MSSGTLCARLYSTRQSVRISWHHGVIHELQPVDPSLAADLWVAPALLDLQVNGFAGVDFQRDDLTEADLLRAAAGLQAEGCGRCLVTLITDRWERMLEKLERLRRLCVASPVLRGCVAGWHMEGPFLSAEPGFCGAHDPGVMIDPSEEHIQQLYAVAQGDPVLLTLAPERAGALKAIACAVSRQMRVSLGHTNASAETLRAAITAGARGFTHLGNACPQQLDRHDNILWRVFDTPGLTVSLIPDGAHVSPTLFRLAHRLLAPEAIYYTSDAVAPAGAPPGRYTVGRHEVEVGPDQIVRQPGATNFAGSGLRPVEGIFRAAAMLGRPWQSVWNFFSCHPAQFMGWSDALAAGQPANFCVLKMTGADRPSSVRTIVQGEESVQSAG